MARTSASELGVCSQSISTQSNPHPPSISVTWVSRTMCQTPICCRPSVIACLKVFLRMFSLSIHCRQQGVSSMERGDVVALQLPHCSAGFNGPGALVRLNHHIVQGIEARVDIGFVQ